MQQHQQDRRRADGAVLDAAIRHLREQIQHSVSSGWYGAVVDGRHVIAGGSGDFREPLAETTGLWAESVHRYLLTVQPLHMLSLLSLLEAVQRDVAAGEASRGVRHAAVELAGRLLAGVHRAA
jgi:hypothetical protein